MGIDCFSIIADDYVVHSLYKENQALPLKNI